MEGASYSKEDLKKQLLMELMDAMRAKMAGGMGDEAVENPVADLVEEKKEEMIEPEPKSALDLDSDDKTPELDDEDKSSLRDFIRGKHTQPKASGVTVEVFGMSKGKKPLSVMAEAMKSAKSGHKFKKGK